MMICAVSWKKNKETLPRIQNFHGLLRSGSWALPREWSVKMQEEEWASPHTGSIRSKVLSALGPFLDLGMITEHGNTFTKIHGDLAEQQTIRATLSDVV